jgi:hypothetical protein
MIGSFVKNEKVVFLFDYMVGSSELPDSTYYVSGAALGIQELSPERYCRRGQGALLYAKALFC